jgi:hypothetical protein
MAEKLATSSVAYVEESFMVRRLLRCVVVYRAKLEKFY